MHALTVPLVTSADGKKFGKSTGGGSLWLDPEMTSPYAWYQYFVNTGDADVVKYLRWFTFLTAGRTGRTRDSNGGAPACARSAEATRSGDDDSGARRSTTLAPSSSPARRCSAGPS